MKRRGLLVISYAASLGCERTGGQASTIDPDRGCTFVRAAPLSGSTQRHRSAVLRSGAGPRFYVRSEWRGRRRQGIEREEAERKR